MKRAAPWEETYTISSSDSSDSDSSDSDSDDDPLANKKGSTNNGGSQSSKGIMSEGAANAAGGLIRRAKMYQEYMKDIPVPNRCGSLVPFTSWQGLAASLKLLYHQPLHYLTNTLLIQWDRARIGSETEHQPLDSVIHPVKAEAIICVAEEVHRLTSSYHHLAKLWASDPKKKRGMDFEALSRHGYHGGPSVLKVPPPRIPDKEQDWPWSTGNRSTNEEAREETYQERERTRTISQGENLLNVQSNEQCGKKDKNMSFSQKEKRKRDLGQASRGKNYVEEEKRLLRDSGIYSGFDS